VIDVIKMFLCFVFCEVAGLALLNGVLSLLERMGLVRLMFPVWVIGTPVIFVLAIVLTFLLGRSLGR
jgi:hypothetical protein